ncbi:hypothetical protein GJAV_G00072460 [Gymnothorax javanicus]|nr:hypothetical protein GJAV_G00072460 [Gymnothorax javanicus]
MFIFALVLGYLPLCVPDLTTSARLLISLESSVELDNTTIIEFLTKEMEMLLKPLNSTFIVTVKEPIEKRCLTTSARLLVESSAELDNTTIVPFSTGTLNGTTP